MKTELIERLAEKFLEEKLGEKCTQPCSSKWVIVRAYEAGVFMGELISRKDREVVLRNARRLWQWSGAASLSQLAMEGTSNPSGCKFPCTVDRIEVLNVCEIVDVTMKAKNSIDAVPVWKV